MSSLIAFSLGILSFNQQQQKKTVMIFTPSAPTFTNNEEIFSEVL